MKKLLMLFAAVFAMSATSFAQVATPASPNTSPSVKVKNKRLLKKTKENTTPIPGDMRKASTPEVRTAKIVDRINTQLVAKDPKLALNENQKAQLIDIYMKRQLTQQSRPKLETEEDKAAFKASRKAASSEFKASVKEVLTPEQAAAYYTGNNGKKARLKKRNNVKANQAPKSQKEGQKF